MRQYSEYLVYLHFTIYVVESLITIQLSIHIISVSHPFCQRHYHRETYIICGSFDYFVASFGLPVDKMMYATGVSLKI